MVHRWNKGALDKANEIGGNYRYIYPPCANGCGVSSFTVSGISTIEFSVKGTPVSERFGCVYSIQQQTLITSLSAN